MWCMRISITHILNILINTIYEYLKTSSPVAVEVWWDAAILKRVFDNLTTHLSQDRACADWAQYGFSDWTVYMTLVRIGKSPVNPNKISFGFYFFIHLRCLYWSFSSCFVIRINCNRNPWLHVNSVIRVLLFFCDEKENEGGSGKKTTIPSFAPVWEGHRTWCGGGSEVGNLLRQSHE